MSAPIKYTVDSRAHDDLTTTAIGVAAALGLIYNDGRRVRAAHDKKG